MGPVSAPPPARQEAEPDGARLRTTSLNWGNSAPLALSAFVTAGPCFLSGH